MKNYSVSKTLVMGIIILFVGTCIVPNVSSIISKEDTLSYDQLDYSGLWTHPDGTQYDIINSFNIWEPKHQTYRNTYHTKDFSIKSNDPKYVKKSPMTNSNGKTLYVGGSGPGNYSSIRLAIYLASDGDTVFVYSGTYYIRGSGITIDKSISLIGENRETTIIDSLPTTWVAPLIRIARTTDGVTISGFTFQNSGGFDADNSGITIHSNYNNISGNIFSNNNCGILLWYPYPPCDYNTISDNIFSDNVYGMIIQGAKYNDVTENVFYNNGMTMEGSDYNVVTDNIFYNGGLVFFESYQNTISGNLINDKPFVYLSGVSDKVIEEDAGQVVLINCDNITVQNKDLSDTTVGLYLEDTHNCLISGNNLNSDELFGIYLLYSSNNNISMNVISETSNGILLDNSYDNNIMSNIITLSKSWGIYLVYSEENIISMNTFSDNYAGLILTGGSNYNEIIDNVFTNDGVWVYGAWENTFLNNSVNDKPLIYLEEETDKVIEEDAGQVVLINCDNITVQDQVISNTYAAIMIVATHNCLISDNIFSSNNAYGIFLTHSNYNNISMNAVSENTYGMALDLSDENIIFGNSINSNKRYGITFGTSEDNIITLNTIISNEDSGISLLLSNSNTILSNTIKENGNILHMGSSIFLDRSSDSKIHRNNFINNVRDAYFYESFSNNWNGNYWGKPRLFPKLIRGERIGIIFWIPWFNIDWRPAQEPYDIS